MVVRGSSDVIGSSKDESKKGRGEREGRTR